MSFMRQLLEVCQGSIENPLEYDAVNAQGTLHMMEAARRQGVKRFNLRFQFRCIW